MEINERLVQLRKSLGLSVRAFADKVNVSGGLISNIENGRRELTDRTILDICREFNVNEKWLRTGEGEMFRDDERSLCRQLAEYYHLSEAGERLIRRFCELPEESRRIIEKLILSSAPDDLTQTEHEYTEHEKMLNTKNTSDGASKTG